MWAEFWDSIPEASQVHRLLDGSRDPAKVAPAALLWPT